MLSFFGCSVSFLLYSKVFLLMNSKLSVIDDYITASLTKINFNGLLKRVYLRICLTRVYGGGVVSSGGPPSVAVVGRCT